MGFNITDITSADLNGIGVIGLADTPNLSASEMQAKFEETARTIIIPKLNDVIDALVTNGMTEEEILQAIEDRIAYIGGGDMSKAVYDTDDDGKVDSAENADTLDSHPRSYFVNTSDTANMYFRGANQIASTTDDTVANWKTLGNGIFWFGGANQLNNQPSSYGFVINMYTGSSDIAQIWISAGATHNMYIRKGNNTGWNGSASDTGTWKKVFLGTMSLSGTTLTITSL